jgi:outer membrane protein assembly factor BamB
MNHAPRSRTLTVVLHLLLLAAMPARAADWPQFRGPLGRGVADESELPVRWTTGDNVRWRSELPGPGASSPVVADGRVFVTACSGPRQDRLHVLCFAAADGRKLWERRLWGTGSTMCHPKTNMAAATPATARGRVFALFGTGDLACFSRDGDLLWYRAFAREYPTFSNQVGLAASPIPWEDLVLLPLENRGRDSQLLGIEQETGRNRWQVARPHEFNWVTPVIHARDGRAELLLQAPPALDSYDPRTGKVNWTLKGPGFNIVAMPIAEGDTIYATGASLTALRPGADHAVPKQVWTAPKLGVNLSSPLYYRGRIYAANPSGVLNCGDPATGKVLWQQRLQGTFSASPVGAAGNVYVMNEEGMTTVFRAGDEALVLGENALEEATLATPAVAGGGIFLRTDRHLYCVAARGSINGNANPAGGPAAEGRK